MNPIFLMDGYKLDHRRQYPKGTTRVYSNWTPRGSRVAGHDRVVFFGLQYFCQKYLTEEFDRGFFSQPIGTVLDRYAKRVRGYLGPDAASAIGTDHIRELHKIGHLPVEICALPEGTAVPLRVPMLTIENTHDDFAWVTNYLETLMSNVLWLPCTSATTALGMRRILDGAAKATGADAGFVDWQAHDFSFRGMSSPESAALSGSAHLLYFTGTDTLPALDLIDEYYAPPGDYLVGASVAATEHSVMCAGEQANELQTFERLLDLYPTGIVSIVSDTWDLWKVLTEILPKLKGRILARNGKVVIRPDSGDPADILCGIERKPVSVPEEKGAVQLLWDVFGGTETSTGHRQLDLHIGLIYGDAITPARATNITERLAAKRFASTNCVFGVGSFTYQYVTRDTYGFALKSTWVKVNGEGRVIAKKPVTDNGVKNSAAGRLAVLEDPNGLYLVERADKDQEITSRLFPVWRDGSFLRRREGFDAVRERARTQLGKI